MLAHAEDRHNVGVVQLGRRPRLALEPVPLLGIAEDLRRQELQSHVAAQGDLLGFVEQLAQRLLLASGRAAEQIGHFIGVGHVRYVHTLLSARLGGDRLHPAGTFS